MNLNLFKNIIKLNIKFNCYGKRGVKTLVTQIKPKNINFNKNFSTQTNPNLIDRKKTDYCVTPMLNRKLDPSGHDCITFQYKCLTCKIARFCANDACLPFEKTYNLGTFSTKKKTIEEKKNEFISPKNLDNENRAQYANLYTTPQIESTDNYKKNLEKEISEEMSIKLKSHFKGKKNQIDNLYSKNNDSNDFNE